MKRIIFMLGLMMAMLLSVTPAQAQQKKSQFTGTWQISAQGQDFLMVISQVEGKLDIKCTDLKGNDAGVYAYGATEEGGKLTLYIDAMEYTGIDMELKLDAKDKNKASGAVAGGAAWVDAVKKK